MSIKPNLIDPTIPVRWEPADALAIKVLAAGTANEFQQQRALSFIINKLCKTYDLSFRADPLQTAFAEGSRNVGLQLVKLVNVDLSKIKS